MKFQIMNILLEWQILKGESSNLLYSLNNFFFNFYHQPIAKIAVDNCIKLAVHLKCQFEKL